MLQLGMIHTNLHLHFSPVVGHALVMLCLRKFPSWSDFGIFIILLLPKCFSECCSQTFFDPTWWLGLEMVCVPQVARWSLNSMANWPRDSRSPRRWIDVNGLRLCLAVFLYPASGNIWHINTHYIWYYEYLWMMNMRPCDRNCGIEMDIRWYKMKPGKNMEISIRKAIWPFDLAMFFLVSYVNHMSILLFIP